MQGGTEKIDRKAQVRMSPGRHPGVTIEKTSGDDVSGKGPGSYERGMLTTVKCKILSRV
jgi:hypothetical protein